MADSTQPASSGGPSDREEKLKRKHGLSVAERLERGSRREGECLVWQGCKCNRWGHGTMNVSGRMKLVHRLAYEDKIGLIPSGVFVCHRCDNPSCINVDHLFLGTHAENMADMVAKGRQRRGESHYAAKLTDEIALKIKHSNAQERDLAQQFGVSPSLIGQIRRGEGWSHVNA